jgi:hypothetical protein
MPSEISPGQRKGKIVRYIFIGTVILSLTFSAVSSWGFLGDNLGQDLCTYMGKGYIPPWYEMYSIVNDEVCIWTPFFYILIVYLFFIAFLPMQIATVIVWLISRFVSRKQKSR